ncbi:MAG: hypothetical protein IJX53_00845 [Clostridia bacterium]|nr:hypothetical protein [Clostridia bacterium]
MKKILAMLLMLGMIASMMVITSSAADDKLYKTMEEAKDGDLLWIVDFNAKDIYDPVYSEAGAPNIQIAIGDDGRSATLTPTANAAASGKWFWGAPIKGLNIDNNSQYTMTFKIKAFGNTGSNNSTGAFGFRYNAAEGETTFNEKCLGMYGNWNSMNSDGTDIKNRSALFQGASRKTNYANVIDEIEADDEGFITVQIEYNVKEAEFSASYMGKDGKWIEDETAFFIFESLDDTPDELVFIFYSYYKEGNATIKDVKFFKGVNLTAAQLAAEAPKAAETTTAAPVTTAAPTTTAAPAATTAAPAATPSTADATTYIVLACAALALTMSVVLKKKEN